MVLQGMEAYFKRSNKPTFRLPTLHKGSNGNKKTYRTWDFPPVRHLPRPIPHGPGENKLSYTCKCILLFSPQQGVICFGKNNKKKTLINKIVNLRHIYGKKEL